MKQKTRNQLVGAFVATAAVLAVQNRERISRAVSGGVQALGTPVVPDPQAKTYDPPTFGVSYPLPNYLTQPMPGGASGGASGAATSANDAYERSDAAKFFNNLDPNNPLGWGT